MEPITPHHFLLGRSNPNLPSNMTGLLSSRMVASTVHRRSSLETLFEGVCTGAQRRKRLRPQRDLRVGDLVIEVVNNLLRGHWPIGRVLCLLPRKYGVVRTAEVRAVHESG